MRIAKVIGAAYGVIGFYQWLLPLLSAVFPRVAGAVGKFPKWALGWPWYVWAILLLGGLVVVLFEGAYRELKHSLGGEAANESDRIRLYRSAKELCNRFIELTNACRASDERQMLAREARFEGELEELERSIKAADLREAIRYSRIVVDIRMAFDEQKHIFNRRNAIHPHIAELWELKRSDEMWEMDRKGIPYSDTESRH